MRLLFEEDGRRALLKKLGFEDVVPEPPAAPEPEPSMDAAAAAAAAGVQGVSLGGAAPAEDFFEQQQVGGVGGVSLGGAAPAEDVFLATAGAWRGTNALPLPRSPPFLPTKSNINYNIRSI